MVPVTYIYDTPEKRNSSYQEFVKALAAKYVTQPVINGAMDSAEWQQLRGPRTIAEEITFAKNLQVAAEGQLLLIKFSAPKAEEAQAAVTQTMKAFCSQFEYDQSARRDNIFKALEQNRNHLKLDLEKTHNSITAAAENWGPDGIRDQREYVISQIRRIETELSDLTIESGPGTIASTANSSDRTMERLLDARYEQNARIAQMDAAGVGANMPQRVTAAQYLKNIEKQIQDRADELQGVAPKNAGPSSQPSVASLLDAKKSELRKRQADLNKDLTSLKDKIALVEKLQIEEARIRRDSDAAEESVHQRNVENILYRLDQSPPDMPLVAARDTRIPISIGGGMGGIMLGFGLVAMVGLFDRRVLDPNDTMKHGRRHPVLGMLPQLPEDLADPEQIAIAAQGVHEIRNRLQLSGGGRPTQQVIAVTGAVAASGKTSLTLGLGLSFASAGFKTLIIDADLVGGGLTTRIDKIVRRKIGQVLLHEGLVTPEQLDEALTQGRASGRRVGEMLVQLGYVAEADLLRAAERQAQYSVGILDAIAGDDLNDCTIATGIDNLCALPLGAATPADAGIVSSAGMQRLVSRARKLYDVVLLDTGPIPGSLEASVAASNSDAVVLVVARGDTRPDVERTLAYLRDLPVRFAGLVFNRARKRDIERYGSSRVSNADSLNPEADSHPVELPGSARFGPIPRCVVSRVSRDPGGYRSN